MLLHKQKLLKRRVSQSTLINIHFSFGFQFVRYFDFTLYPTVHSIILYNHCSTIAFQTSCSSWNYRIEVAISGKGQETKEVMMKHHCDRFPIQPWLLSCKIQDCHGGYCSRYFLQQICCNNIDCRKECLKEKDKCNNCERSVLKTISSWSQVDNLRLKICYEAKVLFSWGELHWKW